MSPISHRGPGAAIAALDSGAAFEIINDGVHVHEAMIALAIRGATGAPVLITAVAAAASTPARVLGLEQECGSIRAGLAADLVHLDDQFRVRRVMVAGRWL